MQYSILGLEVTPSVFDVEEPIPSFKFSGVGTGTTIGGATGGTTKDLPNDIGDTMQK